MPTVQENREGRYDIMRGALSRDTSEGQGSPVHHLNIKARGMRSREISVDVGYDDCQFPLSAVN